MDAGISKKFRLSARRDEGMPLLNARATSRISLNAGQRRLSSSQQRLRRSNACGIASRSRHFFLQGLGLAFVANSCRTLDTADTTRATSCASVCQLHTDTRMQRLPRQVVLLKSASPPATTALVTASVQLS